MTGELGATCFLTVGSTGAVLEDYWITLESAKDEEKCRISKSNQKCLEEQQALDYFHSTVKLSVNRRFDLQLPFKVNTEDLGVTICMAT